MMSINLIHRPNNTHRITFRLKDLRKCITCTLSRLFQKVTTSKSYMKNGQMHQNLFVLFSHDQNKLSEIESIENILRRLFKPAILEYQLPI